MVITITPDSGFAVLDVTVNGVSVGAVSSYTFSNVTEDHTVEVVFAILTYTVTPTVGSNGTANYTTAQTVNYGADLTFTFSPNTGYEVDDVLVDGVSVGAVSSYTFSNVTEDHTVEVVFAILTYTVTPTIGSNGTANYTTAQTVNYGADLTFTFSPNTGYEVDDVLVDGVSVGDGDVYTFNSIAANHTIEVVFAVAPTVTVTPTIGSNGTVTPNTAQVINRGDSITFTILPAENYRLSDLTVDGVSVTDQVATYTLTNAQANKSIGFTFALATYPPTANAGADVDVLDDEPDGAVSFVLDGSASTGGGSAVSPALNNLYDLVGKPYGTALNYYRIFQNDTSDTLVADVATYEAIPKANMQIFVWENAGKQANLGTVTVNSSNVYNSSEDWQKHDRMTARVLANYPNLLTTPNGRRGLKHHVLFWYNSQPAPVVAFPFANEAELFEYMNGYIDRAFTHLTDFWLIDVWNEELNSSGTHRSNVYTGYSSDPLDAMEHAYKRCDLNRSADQLLVYNEYSWTSGLPSYPKIPNTLTMLQQLLDRNTPIDVVGIQAHFQAIYYDTYQQDLLAGYIEQIEQMGLYWQFSEADLKTSNTSGQRYNENTNSFDSSGTADMARRKKLAVNEHMAQLAANSNRNIGFMHWGFYGGQTWLNSIVHPNVDPLPWEDDYSPVSIDGQNIPDVIRDEIASGNVRYGFTPSGSETYPIISYQWLDESSGVVASGAGVPVPETINLTGLNVGDYPITKTYTLRVTDNRQVWDSDQVDVVIDEPISEETFNLQNVNTADTGTSSGATFSTTFLQASSHMGTSPLIRFDNLQVSQGATLAAGDAILTLPIQWRSWLSSGTLRAYGFDVDNVGLFSSSNHKPHLAITTANVAIAFNPPGTDPGLPPETISFNVGEIVQEIVNRAGWVSGNAIGFILEQESFASFKGYTTSESGGNYYNTLVGTATP